jgi:hypothetical protein
MEGLEILEGGGNVLVLVPTKRHGAAEAERGRRPGEKDTI